MSIKITNYITQTANIASNSKTTIHTSAPSETSFEDVLVLNQSALRAMTIDAMIAESPTGSISSDAVNAAAIMKFRSTLTNVVAPIPPEDASTKAPSHVSGTITNTENTTNASNTTTSGTNNTSNSSNTTTNSTNNTSNNSNTTASDTKDTTNNTQDTSNVSSTTPSQGTSSSNNTSSVDISDVYNSGSLVCNDTLNTYFKEAAIAYNLDVKLLKAIAKTESDFDPSNTSKSGAMGIMQLMPNTAKYLGVTNAYDARQCIMGGAKYIAKKYKLYDGNLSLTLASYHAGSGNVKKYGGVPPFSEKYVAKVLKYYNE